MLTVREHFFIEQDTPYLVVFLTYKPGERLPAKAAANTPRKKDEWRSMLSEEQMPLFNSLRDWRNTRAGKIGIPPYLIATNVQLADMAIRQPASLAALSKIEGFGAVRLENYGKELLTILVPQSTVKPASEESPQHDLFTQPPEDSAS